MICNRQTDDITVKARAAQRAVPRSGPRVRPSGPFRSEHFYNCVETVDSTMSLSQWSDVPLPRRRTLLQTHQRLLQWLLQRQRRPRKRQPMLQVLISVAEGWRNG